MDGMKRPATLATLSLQNSTFLSQAIFVIIVYHRFVRKCKNRLVLTLITQRSLYFPPRAVHVTTWTQGGSVLRTNPQSTTPLCQFIHTAHIFADSKSTPLCKLTKHIASTQRVGEVTIIMKFQFSTLKP